MQRNSTIVDRERSYKYHDHYTYDHQNQDWGRALGRDKQDCTYAWAFLESHGMRREYRDHVGIK